MGVFVNAMSHVVERGFCSQNAPDIAASVIFAACRQCVTSLRSFAAC